VCNSRGSELLAMCTAANMLILNVRTFSGSLGNYTCFQYNGNSVVDLCIVSETLYYCILFFQVKYQVPLLSDHSCICVKIVSFIMKLIVIKML